MAKHDLPNNEETQAEAGLGTLVRHERIAAWRLDQGLEDGGQFFRRDRTTRIAHHQHHSVICALGPQRNGRLPVAMLNGIVQEVRQHLPQSNPVRLSMEVS